MNLLTRFVRLASTSLLLAAAAAPAGCAAADENVDDAESADENIPDDSNGEPVSSGADAIVRSDFVRPNLSDAQKAEILEKYGHVDPNKAIDKAKREALLFYYDVNKSRIENQDYAVVVDFRKPSKEKRFFMIDMRSGAVTGYVMAHGSGSDPNNDGSADRFSNVKNSNASSLGYYLTAEVYNGKHGRSLRMDGLSDSNSNVRARDVVIHGANYVRDGRSKQGMSWGCFALAQNVKDGIISKLQGGALIYAEK